MAISPLIIAHRKLNNSVRLARVAFTPLLLCVDPLPWIVSGVLSDIEACDRLISSPTIRFLLLTVVVSAGPVLRVGESGLNGEASVEWSLAYTAFWPKSFKHQITNATATSQENRVSQELTSSEFTDWLDASLAIPDTEKPDKQGPK